MKSVHSFGESYQIDEMGQLAEDRVLDDGSERLGNLQTQDFLDEFSQHFILEKKASSMAENKQ